MPPQSPPQPPFPRPAEDNEFADAVARMFERRQRLAPDFAPSPRGKTVHDDVDRWVSPGASWLSSLSAALALRRVLLLVPLAVIGYAIAWFLYLQPENVTAGPVDETRQEAAQVVAAPLQQSPSPPTEAAESKAAPAEVVTTPAAPAPAAAAPVASATPGKASVAVDPPRSLTKDEIKELQGKLTEAGFNAGPVDGVVGPQTEAALRRYAQARSLAKPEANRETLLLLRSETKAKP